MTIFVASDIHGSAYYCEEILKAYQREGADKLLLLGDLLYHGPRNELPRDYDTKKCTALLNEAANELMCVRGNCDSEVDQMVLKFPIMADYALLYAGKRMIFATHGHLFNEDDLPMLHKGDILLHGHTHVSFLHEHEDYVCINPGSVSLPKEDTPRGYMLITDEKITWHTLDGNVYREYRL